MKSRTRQMVVGTYQERGAEAWVEPREIELERIRVPKTQLARPGDAVKVRLGVGTSLIRGGGLTGEVAGSLGAEDDHSVEVLSVAFSQGFQDEFPSAVMDEADAFPVTVQEADATAPGRKDLRKLGLITIDGEDARDFDDAICVEDTAARLAAGGRHRRRVALRARGHRAGRRGPAPRAPASTCPGRVLPMLPERLSNGHLLAQARRGPAVHGGRHADRSARGVTTASPRSTRR